MALTRHRDGVHLYADRKAVRLVYAHPGEAMRKILVHGHVPEPDEPLPALPLGPIADRAPGEQTRRPRQRQDAGSFPYIL